MKKFEIKEEDVIDIDRYISERTEIKKKNLSFKKKSTSTCWTTCHILF